MTFSGRTCGQRITPDALFSVTPPVEVFEPPSLSQLPLTLIEPVPARVPEARTRSPVAVSAPLKVWVATPVAGMLPRASALTSVAVSARL